MKLDHILTDSANAGKELARLREAKGFDYLVTIVGEDFGEEGLGCVYILENTQTHGRVSVKAIAERIGDDHVLPTATGLWKAAEFLEREVYDMLGIKFTGHPDMRRLFLRSDFRGHPLRKDYDTSPENNRYPTTDEPESGYTSTYHIGTDGQLVETRRRLFEEDDFVVNIGPNHPSTHGVLRLQTIADGETIKKIYPHLGYIHRGMEKMCEEFTYPQTLAMADRMDYLSANINRHALCGVIEEALGVELTDRIKYIRTIVDELQRLDSHLLYIGCCAQDLGALTAFLYAMRDREHVLNVLEETTGGRLIQNYYRIGGCQADIDPDFVRNVKALCNYMKPMFQEYMDVFGNNIITKKRLCGVGPMSREDVISYGVTGGSGRSSGWSNDVRKHHPYAMYAEVEFDEITNGMCDSYGRYLVRIEEMKQSIRIMEQLIDNIPPGDYYVKQKAVIKVPEGQWYFSCEGSRGEIGVYLDSRGEKMPYRLKFRPMGLNHVAAMDEMLRGQKIADLITAGAALDFVIPDIDR